MSPLVVGPVDLDQNATAPLRPEALGAWIDAVRAASANPSSTHSCGQLARRRLQDARASVAAELGCRPGEVVFTSGATESNHLALHGARQVADAIRPAAGSTARRRLVISSIEHPGLMALGRRLEDDGIPVTWLPVTRDGVVDLDAAAHAIGADVGLVSVMTANNETGVLQPIPELAALAHRAGALLHTDATQALGRVALPIAHADLLTVSAHKIGGPRGVGALVTPGRTTWPAQFDGRQERGRRGGTENLPGIAGFAAALRASVADAAAERPRMARLRDRLENCLVREFGATVIGGSAPRLPNTSCVRFGQRPAEAVLARLDRAGVCASSGSACGSGRSEPSHVLRAMGLAEEDALAAVRFSVGYATTDAELDRAIAALDVALRAGQTEPEPA